MIFTTLELATSNREPVKRASAPLLVFEDTAQAVMVPEWARNTEAYQREWGAAGKPQEAAKRARKLIEGDQRTNPNEFLAPFHGIKLSLLLHGFEVIVPEAIAKKAPWLEAEAKLLMADLCREWLIADNAAFFWLKGTNRQSGAPAVTVLDTEQIDDYRNGFGGEVLKLKVPTAKDGLPDRWKNVDAIQLDATQGEFYRVLTRAKRGKGLAMPALNGAMPVLGMLGTLAVGDGAGALETRNIIRQILIGHEIKQGERAGRPDHFIKPAEVDAVKKQLKGKTGKLDMTCNFDWAIKYTHFPTEFFDAKKYEGALARYRAWVGPVAYLLQKDLPGGALIALRAWGETEREAIGGFLEELLNAKEYWQGSPQAERIRVKFHPHTFADLKWCLEAVRFGVGQALMSPQTGAELLGLDNQRERELIRVARKTPEDYTPVFEQKQGMAGGGDEGGRPVVKPGDAA